MLRKCENRSIPHRIVKIITAGSRIIAFDQQESAFFIKYRIKENQLTIFADDTYPRYVFIVTQKKCKKNNYVGGLHRHVCWTIQRV